MDRKSSEFGIPTRLPDSREKTNWINFLSLHSSFILKFKFRKSKTMFQTFDGQFNCWLLERFKSLLWFKIHFRKSELILNWDVQIFVDLLSFRNPHYNLVASNFETELPLSITKQIRTVQTLNFRVFAVQEMNKYDLWAVEGCYISNLKIKNQLTAGISWPVRLQIVRNRWIFIDFRKLFRICT